jgi:hypothetical protein
MLEEHFGFDDFTILIDTDPSSEQPTGANIKVSSSSNTSSSSSSGVDRPGHKYTLQQQWGGAGAAAACAVHKLDLSFKP